MSRAAPASAAAAPARSGPFGIACRPARAAPADRIERDPDRCVHCGGCVARCDSGALAVDPATFQVTFDTTRCHGCRRCLAACGYRALGFGPEPAKEQLP